MIHRRDAMLRLGQLGAGALTLPQLLGQRAHATEAAGSARSCILVYLWGGPPQQDMWDLKPEAPSGIRSPFQPISTVVPGIEVCEHLPELARHADKFAIVRSLSHESNNHEPSVYRTLTGRINNTLVVPRNQRGRSEFPTVGSVVSAFSRTANSPGPFSSGSLVSRSSMPAAVTVPRPIGHSGVTYAGTWAGFLGARHDPFELQAAADTSERPAFSFDLPADLGNARLLARRGLLDVIDDLDRRFQHAPPARTFGDNFEEAFSMLSSPQAKEAFQLDREPPEVRDRYGRNEWGESLLLARRLVEAGVRLVTISWMYIKPDGKVANVWDNHGPFLGLNGTQMLLAEYCLPSLNQGFGALMEDLSATGQLDETLVAMYGEFGRTPQLNSEAGRDHWGMCQSAILAGGGIQGGQVYGSSDGHAAYPATNPVTPEDMLATIYHSLGIPPHALMHDQTGRPHVIAEGSPIHELF